MKRLVFNTGIAKVALLSCSLFIGQLVVAQNNITTPQYIEMYKNMAIDEMDRSGIPASITLAQGILESSSGNSELARFANNHFGIKCHNGWAGGEYYKKDDDRNHKGQLIKSCFRVYGSAYESYMNHTAFLTGKQRYAFLFNYPKEDYISWAKGLKTAGYATNPVYADKLIRVIEENNLSQYDYMTNRRQVIAQTTTTITTPTPQPVVKESAPIVEKVKEETKLQEPEKTIVAVSEQKPPSPNDWSSASIDNMDEIRESGTSEYAFPKQYQSGVFTVNQVKVVSAKKGDTPYEVAVREDINVKKLLKYNDLKQGDKLITNQYVFLQSKRGKYREPRTYHRVAASDNMYIISQLYGIKLTPLMMRNMLEEKEEPAIGEKIFLNGKAKSKPILRRKSIKRPKSKGERVPKKDIKNFVDEPLAKISESMKPKQEQKKKVKKSTRSKTIKKGEKRIYEAVTTQNAKSNIAKEQVEIEASEEYTPHVIAKVVNPTVKPVKEQNPIIEREHVAVKQPSTPEIPDVAVPEVIQEKQPTAYTETSATVIERQPEIQYPLNSKPVHQEPIQHTAQTPASYEMSTPNNEQVEVMSEYYIVVDENGNMKKVPVDSSPTSIENATSISSNRAIETTYESPAVTEKHVIRSEPITPEHAFTEQVGEPYYMEETTAVYNEPTPSPQQWEIQEPSTNTAKMHTVQKGDTLYSLSKKYNVKIQTIRSINGITMNTIKVGQTLRLD